MTSWPSSKATRVLAALYRIGWTLKRQSGSHKTLSRPGWPDVVFAFHDREEIGPRMLTRISKRTGFGEPLEMKKSSSSRISKTDWKRVRGMKDRDITLTAEHPELDLKHIARVIVRKGLKPVSVKKSISLRVDAEVLAWFQAQGPGYQTRMNAVLKAFKDASL